MSRHSPSLFQSENTIRVLTIGKLANLFPTNFQISNKQHQAPTGAFYELNAKDRTFNFETTSLREQHWCLFEALARRADVILIIPEKASDSPRVEGTLSATAAIERLSKSSDPHLQALSERVVTLGPSPLDILDTSELKSSRPTDYQEIINATVESVIDSALTGLKEQVSKSRENSRNASPRQTPPAISLSA